jgi:hypothetical protein
MLDRTSASFARLPDLIEADQGLSIATGAYRSCKPSFWGASIERVISIGVIICIGLKLRGDPGSTVRPCPGRGSRKGVWVHPVTSPWAFGRALGFVKSSGA